MMNLRILPAYLLVLLACFEAVLGHAHITVPTPRPYTYLSWAGGLNAPAYKCEGPTMGTSATSMRCHDNGVFGPITTITAGKTFNMQWTFEAPHPGDCSVWISYDSAKAAPEKWIKLANFPGCLAKDGLVPPEGNVNIAIPANLPPCEHCVLRWEYLAAQQVTNVEFYVNCADVKVVSASKCTNAGATTSISGIEYLGTGCPWYNPYMPPFNTNRAPGPKAWNGVCLGSTPTPPTTPPTTTPPTTTKKNLVVYDNKISTLFADWSWSGGIANFRNFAWTAPVISAPSSIRYVPGNWNALYFMAGAGVKATTYSGLQFYIHGGRGTTKLTVRLRDRSQDEIGSSVTITANTGAWKKIVIPFDTSFKIATSQLIGGFTIQSGAATRPALYIDSIVLIARGTTLAPLLSAGDNSTIPDVDEDGNVPDLTSLTDSEGLDIAPESSLDDEVATSSASTLATSAALALLVLACIFAF